ncbi:MAG: hypothetical protein Q8L00_13575, partial [Deltaproteobacteria bacterium]|nr:hypothetical protein [Deltaproteobacteria bacterium]
IFPDIIFHAKLSDFSLDYIRLGPGCKGYSGRGRVEGVDWGRGSVAPDNFPCPPGGSKGSRFKVQSSRLKAKSKGS